MAVDSKKPRVLTLVKGREPVSSSKLLSFAKFDRDFFNKVSLAYFIFARVKLDI